MKRGAAKQTVESHAKYAEMEDLIDDATDQGEALCLVSTSSLALKIVAKIIVQAPGLNYFTHCFIPFQF